MIDEVEDLITEGERTETLDPLPGQLDLSGIVESGSL